MVIRVTSKKTEQRPTNLLIDDMEGFLLVLSNLFYLRQFPPNNDVNQFYVVTKELQPMILVKLWQTSNKKDSDKSK